MKIFYGAGHGKHTAGKRSPDGEREWTFNNEVALGFAKEMKKYANVTLQRTDDSTANETYRFRKEQTKRIKQMLTFTFLFIIMPIRIIGEIGQAWRHTFIKHRQKVVN